jgi:hypothetical protein
LKRNVNLFKHRNQPRDRKLKICMPWNAIISIYYLGELHYLASFKFLWKLGCYNRSRQSPYDQLGLQSRRPSSTNERSPRLQHRAGSCASIALTKPPHPDHSRSRSLFKGVTSCPLPPPFLPPVSRAFFPYFLSSWAIITDSLWPPTHLVCRSQRSSVSRCSSPCPPRPLSFTGASPRQFRAAAIFPTRWARSPAWAQPLPHVPEWP